MMRKLESHYAEGTIAKYNTCGIGMFAEDFGCGFCGTEYPLPEYELGVDYDVLPKSIDELKAAVEAWERFKKVYETGNVKMSLFDRFRKKGKPDDSKPGKLANQLGPEAREEIAGAAGNGDAAVLPREEAKKTILIKFKTPNGERQLSVPIGVDVIGYAIREFSGEFGTVIVSKEPNSNIYEIVPEQAPPEQGAPAAGQQKGLEARVDGAAAEQRGPAQPPKVKKVRTDVAGLPEEDKQKILAAPGVVFSYELASGKVSGDYKLLGGRIYTVSARGDIAELSKGTKDYELAIIHIRAVGFERRAAKVAELEKLLKEHGEALEAANTLRKQAEGERNAAVDKLAEYEQQIAQYGEQLKKSGDELNHLKAKYEQLSQQHGTTPSDEAELIREREQIITLEDRLGKTSTARDEAVRKAGEADKKYAAVLLEIGAAQTEVRRYEGLLAEKEAMLDALHGELKRKELLLAETNQPAGTPAPVPAPAEAQKPQTTYSLIDGPTGKLVRITRPDASQLEVRMIGDLVLSKGRPVNLTAEEAAGVRETYSGKA